MRCLRSRRATLGVLAFIAANASGATIETNPTQDFRSLMQNLHPGDTLILDDGTYPLSSYFELALAGTSAQPITIVAKAGARPAIRYADASQNIVNIVHASFLTLDGIEFSGGSRGLRFIGGSDITLRNCLVHGTAANAIAANDSGEDYARFQFIHNEIHHTGVTGEGFYLGCNGDLCRIHDSVIANNYIHDLQGASADYQGDGIEIKKGSYANIVRDNVIHDTHYPGITMYDVNGHGAPNIIERNLIWNSDDSGIQVTADAIVRNNIVLGATNNAFFSNNIDGGSANNLIIVNNTFLMPQGDGIRLNGVSGSVRIVNNLIYAPGNYAIRASGTTSGIVSLENAGDGNLTGVGGGFSLGSGLANDFVQASLSGAPPQNLIPINGQLIGVGSTIDQPADDFDGHPRGSHADLGAYCSCGVLGWKLNPEFKRLDDIYFGTFDR